MDFLTIDSAVKLATVLVAVIGAFFAAKYAIKQNSTDIKGIKADNVKRDKRITAIEEEAHDFKKCFYQLRGDIRELIGILKGKGIVDNSIGESK